MIVAVFLGIGSILAARDGVVTGWIEAWFSLGLVVTAVSIWKRRWGLACVGVLVMLCIPGIQVPTSARTPAAMGMMKRRILRYANTDDRLPAAIDDLPVIEGDCNDTKDAWGREILYEVRGDQVTLTSYGRDATPGGNGPDADIIGIFQARNDKGN